jgi:alpha-galactosidase
MFIDQKPDANMLPLGHIGLRAERGDDRLSLLSHDEQTSLMTLLCIFRSPLMMGGDLTTLDPFTRSPFVQFRCPCGQPA